MKKLLQRSLIYGLPVVALSGFGPLLVQGTAIPWWALLPVDALAGYAAVTWLPEGVEKMAKRWKVRRSVKAQGAEDEPMTVGDIIAKQAPQMKAPLTADQKVRFAKEIARIGNRLQYEALTSMGVRMRPERAERHMMMLTLTILGGFIPDIDLSEWDLDVDQRAFVERVEYAYRSMVNQLVQEYGLIAPDVVSLFEKQAEDEAKAASERAKQDFWKKFE